MMSVEEQTGADGEQIKERAKPAALLFLDLETTGLDPRGEHILEIAWRLTSFAHPYEPAEVVWFGDPLPIPPAHLELPPGTQAEVVRTSGCVRIGGPGVEKLLSGGCHPVVTEMHAKSGLTADLQSGIMFGLAHIEQELLKMSDYWPSERMGHDKERKVCLAGSSVHFDLSFLREHMPTFAKRLSYRVFDVSAVSMFCRSLGMPSSKKDEAAHRAQEDMEGSIRIAKECRDWLLSKTASAERRQPDFTGWDVAEVRRELASWRVWNIYVLQRGDDSHDSFYDHLATRASEEEARVFVESLRCRDWVDLSPDGPTKRGIIHWGARRDDVGADFVVEEVVL